MSGTCFSSYHALFTLQQRWEVQSHVHQSRAHVRPLVAQRCEILPLDGLQASSKSCLSAVRSASHAIIHVGALVVNLKMSRFKPGARNKVGLCVPEAASESSLPQQWLQT